MLSDAQSPNGNFCGESWVDAVAWCRRPCPTGAPTQCGDGETCFADTPCNNNNDNTTNNNSNNNNNVTTNFAPSVGGTDPSGFGTCGDGQIGNGICPNNAECCSQYGHCGTTPAHCDNQPSLFDPIQLQVPNGEDGQLPMLDVTDILQLQFQPIWLSGREGWNGGSYLDAVAFCNSIRGKALCPYAAMCPTGPGNAVMGGRDSIEFTVEGEQYAPIAGKDNQWVMIGDLASTPKCQTYREIEGTAPEWGLSGERAELKQHIMCCTNGFSTVSFSDDDVELPELGPTVSLEDTSPTTTTCPQMPSLRCQNGSTCQEGVANFGKQHDHLNLQTHESGWYCNCINGYIGHECQIAVDDCDDRTGTVSSCYHGAKCKQTNDANFYCDCDELNRNSGGTATKFAGSMCQYESTSLCAANLFGANVDDQFCTNHGLCVEMVGNADPHPGCVCKPGWAGERCEIQEIPTPLEIIHTTETFGCNLCEPGQYGVNTEVLFNGEVSTCMEIYNWFLANFGQGSGGCRDGQEELSRQCCRDDDDVGTNSHEDTFPYAKPAFRFGPFQDLDIESQTIAEERLGYTVTTWNVFSLAPIEKKRWASLSQNEREGAVLLGYTEDTWDCFINHYKDYTWDDLAASGVQTFYQGLGWTQSFWEGTGFGVPTAESKWWGQLNDDEKRFANALCFFEDNWDRNDMNPNFSIFPHPVPDFRYRPWDVLSASDQNVAMNLLGYTEETWNNLSTTVFEKSTFLNLDPDVQAGAIELGFYTNTWDCFINHYQS